MAASQKRIHLVATGALLLLMAVLVLQALGYGIGFFFDPESGLGEFASPPPPGGDDLTVALIGLIGAGMLSSAALLVLSAVLVFRREPVGPRIAIAVGLVHVLAGVSVLRSGWIWDASFYAGSGGVLVLLSVVVQALGSARARDEELRSAGAEAGRAGD